MNFIENSLIKDDCELILKKLKNEFLILFPKLQAFNIPISHYNSTLSDTIRTYFDNDNISIYTTIDVEDSFCEPEIIYELAHELTHIVFSIYREKEDNNKATCLEESICTAVSLVMINKHFPERLRNYEDSLISKKCFYFNGIRIAKRINYDENKLLDLIINSDIEHSPIANYDKTSI